VNNLTNAHAVVDFNKRPEGLVLAVGSTGGCNT
jgi:Tfp pilus assembly pilus retraction ATPase PilT